MQLRNSVQPADLSSRRASYCLGLLDPLLLKPVVFELSEEAVEDASFTLLVPHSSYLPSSLLHDPDFQRAALDAYFECDVVEDITSRVPLSPASVTNWVCSVLEECNAPSVSLFSAVGYVLGGLTSLIEKDRVLALVGFAHLCYLLSLLARYPVHRFPLALSEMGDDHNEAVRAYRDLVSTHRARGLDYAAATQAALAGLHYAGQGSPVAYAEEVA